MRYSSRCSRSRFFWRVVRSGPNYTRPAARHAGEVSCARPLPADEAASLGDLKWFEVFGDDKLQSADQDRIGQ